MAPQEPNVKKSQLQKAVSAGFELVKLVLLAAVIVIPIRYFLFQPFIVKGESMSPNFESGDYLIVDEISYKISGLHRGDVVVFDYPKDVTQRFIKRVIGLPGETVVVKSGTVYISKDGTTTTLTESYLPQDLKTYGETTLTLAEGEYFVMGDNREYSYDSRIWGAVPQRDLIGRPLIRLFPITSLGFIPHPSY